MRPAPTAAYSCVSASPPPSPPSRPAFRDPRTRIRHPRVSTTTTRPPAQTDTDPAVRQTASIHSLGARQTTPSAPQRRGRIATPLAPDEAPRKTAGPTHARAPQTRQEYTRASDSTRAHTCVPQGITPACRVCREPWALRHAGTGCVRLSAPTRRLQGPPPTAAASARRSKAASLPAGWLRNGREEGGFCVSRPRRVRRWSCGEGEVEEMAG